MDARIDVITLAVDDFERALAFYRALGFESKGVVATEFTGDDTHPAGAIAQIHLDNGQILALYPRSELAKDAGIPLGPAQSGELSLGQIVATRDDVDALLAKAKTAGAPVSELHDRPWGIYSGYFRDPDGHLWEIITGSNT
jgi:hypothetical protein